MKMPDNVFDAIGAMFLVVLVCMVATLAFAGGTAIFSDHRTDYCYIEKDDSDRGRVGNFILLRQHRPWSAESPTVGSFESVDLAIMAAHAMECPIASTKPSKTP